MHHTVSEWKVDRFIRRKGHCTQLKGMIRRMVLVDAINGTYHESGRYH